MRRALFSATFAPEVRFRSIFPDVFSSNRIVAVPIKKRLLSYFCRWKIGVRSIWTTLWASPLEREIVPRPRSIRNWYSPGTKSASSPLYAKFSKRCVPGGFRREIFNFFQKLVHDMNLFIKYSICFFFIKFLREFTAEFSNFVSHVAGLHTAGADFRPDQAKGQGFTPWTSQGQSPSRRNSFRQRTTRGNSPNVSRNWKMTYVSAIVIHRFSGWFFAARWCR